MRLHPFEGSVIWDNETFIKSLDNKEWKFEIHKSDLDNTVSASLQIKTRRFKSEDYCEWWWKPEFIIPILGSSHRISVGLKFGVRLLSICTKRRLAQWLQQDPEAMNRITYYALTGNRAAQEIIKYQYVQ